MQEHRAEVSGSVWRAETLLGEFAEGAVVPVRVVLVRSGDWPLCIGAVHGKYRIELTGEGLQEGTWVQVHIDRFNSANGWLTGTVVP